MNHTELVELTDEAGNVDLCEVESAPSTRVIRTIKRIKSAPLTDFEDKSYQIQYQHACGYRD